MGAAGPLAAVSQIASAGAKVYGDLQTANASKTQGQIQSMRSQVAAKAAEVRADQTSAAYYQQLESGLATLQVASAGQGVGVDSATRRALAARGEDLNEQQRQIGAGNQRLAAITARGDAQLAQTAARNAMMASYLKAGVDTVGLGQSIYSGAKGLWDG